jgi:hypothetical protein
MQIGNTLKRVLLVPLFALLVSSVQQLAAADQPKDLASALTPLVSALSGKPDNLSYRSMASHSRSKFACCDTMTNRSTSR